MHQFDEAVSTAFDTGAIIPVDLMLKNAPEGGLLEMTVIAADAYSGARHAIRRT